MLPTLTVGIAAFRTLTGDKEQSQTKTKKKTCRELNIDEDMVQY